MFAAAKPGFVVSEMRRTHGNAAATIAAVPSDEALSTTQTSSVCTSSCAAMLVRQARSNSRTCQPTMTTVMRVTRRALGVVIALEERYADAVCRRTQPRVERREGQTPPHRQFEIGRIIRRKFVRTREGQHFTEYFRFSFRVNGNR